MISLGSFCSVALEIERYGLRDGSYPFDWVISNLEDVLALIDSGFESFLDAAALKQDSKFDYIVHDTRTNIALYHDFTADSSIEAQYPSVRAKYDRRIARFYQATSEPTLFIRYLSGQAEFDYLESNLERLMGSIKRLNPSNNLMLIGDTNLPTTCGGIPVYMTPVDESDTVARRLADQNVALHRRLLWTRYPITTRMANLMRYTSKRVRRRLSRIKRISRTG